LPPTLSEAPRIRRATVSDAELVTNCQTTCWREAYAGLVDYNYLYSAEIEERRLVRWRERLARARTVWLAQADCAVVGVASAGPSRDDPPPTAVELMSLYLRVTHHGSGLAGRLLHAAIGTGPASLWVFAANVRAQRFYRRHGFVLDGAEKIDDDTGLLEVRMVRSCR